MEKSQNESEELNERNSFFFFNSIFEGEIIVVVVIVVFFVVVMFSNSGGGGGDGFGCVYDVLISGDGIDSLLLIVVLLWL